MVFMDFCEELVNAINHRRHNLKMSFSSLRFCQNHLEQVKKKHQIGFFVQPDLQCNDVLLDHGQDASIYRDLPVLVA